LATTVVSPLVSVAVQQGSLSHDRRYAAGLVSGLTCLAVLVHGYHPYAEDGGLYLAGIKRLLDPGLYPRETAFVDEHLRFSIFAPAIAALIRWSRLSVETIIFFLYVAALWITLFAAWKLVARCYDDRRARTGAVALLAVWLTLPVAGTSLLLIDPYLTARSVSTPCALVAFSQALDLDNRERHVRALMLSVCALIIGMLFHPLMTAYAAACILILAVMLRFRSSWPWTLGLACLAAVGAAAILQAFSAREGPEYARVALTRVYWFLSQWRWYELFGLAAPLTIFAIMALSWRNNQPKRAALAQMSVTVGVASIIVALLFARVDSATHLLARLQPLRIFQPLYLLMVMFLGAEMARHFLQERVVRWAVTFAALASIMLVTERRVYPASAHIEWPWHTMRSTETNPWTRAFLWVRDNTSRDALVALDADYIEKPNEDAQCFRAIAERSALPDYSKDGGEASISPSLAQDWIDGESAQKQLSTETDEKRISALKSFGVDWVVLEKNAITGFACDYANEAVKVCRMPQQVRASLSSSRALR
jgi:hypothetical protein